MSSHWPPSIRRPNAEAQRESVLAEAARLVAGKRGADYGHPLDNHGCTSEMFSAYVYRKYGVRIPFDPEDTCVFNVLQKVSREANRPQRDNVVDGAGYFENIQMVRDERARRNFKTS